VTRVLVAAASSLGRANLKAAIEADGSLELVGLSAPDGVAQEVEDLEPDIVVLMDGHDHALAPSQAISLRRDETGFPALVVLTEAQPAELDEALHAGISALLPLEATPSEIRAAIKAVTTGLLVIHPAFLDLRPETAPAATAAPTEVLKPSLTPREVEVLNLMAQGLGNKEIAWRLHISEHTVKFHIGSIFNKLDASGRTEAVTLGIRAGLIML
jgi:two-component system, NarL family, response regulator YdfI